MNILSKNMELRFISHDPAANGETDFKGETSMLTTQQRVDYLNAYAQALPRYVDNFSLDEPIVTLEAAKARLAQVKPQPKPAVRRRIALADWRFTGDCSQKERRRIAKDAGKVEIA
ncbi:MAG: hypothetical protein IJ313_04355, partial [Clostridia bacterium]|nr:hypothetical protein [Clostridia bacterium]